MCGADVVVESTCQNLFAEFRFGNFLVKVLLRPLLGRIPLMATN